MADAFLARILPLLEQPTVLITHNSDAHIGQPHRAALNGHRIVHWFAQNVSIDHQKLTALPIGVANAQWKHGDTSQRYRRNGLALRRDWLRPLPDPLDPTC
jgi:hypothetical protein